MPKLSRSCRALVVGLAVTLAGGCAAPGLRVSFASTGTIHALVLGGFVSIDDGPPQALMRDSPIEIPLAPGAHRVEISARMAVQTKGEMYGDLWEVEQRLAVRHAALLQASSRSFPASKRSGDR